MQKKLLFIVALLFSFLSYSQIANTPNDYVVCDNDEDGFTQINLDTVITPQVLGTQDPQDLEVTYHTNLSNVNSGTYPITNTSNYTNTWNYQSIYVRVFNTVTGAFATTSFRIIVETTPIFNDNLHVEFCNYSDGFSQEINAVEYQNELISNNDDFFYTYTYYETEADADADINAIADPSNYNNSSNNLFTLYIRATSKFLGCFYATTSFEIYEFIPYFNNTDPLEMCSTTDTETFNLELNYALNETGDQTITYHATSSDAYSNVNPLPFKYQNTSNPQTIYIRSALNYESEFVSDCYVVRPLDLIVNTGTPVTANDIGDQTVCGAELNYDLTQHETAIKGGDIGTTITYYTSLEYLQYSFEPIANPSSITLNEIGINTYYVRVDSDALNCFNTTKINITVQSDLTLDTATLNNCESSLDYDLQLAINQINNAFDGNITFHETEADALSNSSAISNINNYTASSANQTLYSSGLISLDCYAVGTVELIANSGPTGNTIPTQNLCGFPQEHDITTVESDIIGTQNNVTASYFTSLADLESNINPINNATNINFDTAGSYPFYVRLDSDLTDCYSSVEIEFLVSEEFVSTDTYLAKCDDDLDGISTFNLQNAIPQITAESNVTIAFFETIEDAQAKTNAIANTASYTNTTPSLQLIYCSVTNASGCNNNQLLYLLVSGIDPVTSVPSLDTCDDNYNDGFATFELSDIKNDVIGNNPSGQFSVNYFLTLSDAENYTNSLPLTFTNTVERQQVIYARTTWQYDLECNYIVPVELNVMATPDTVLNNLQLFGCDENNDGIIVFDLDSKIDDILNGTPDTEIKFYRILAESLDESKALTSPYYTPGTIWAKATNSSGCSTAVQLELVVEDCPEFVTCGAPVSTTYCYTENDTTEFRFKSIDGSPLVVVFNTGEIEYGFDYLNVFDSDGVTNLNTETPWGNAGDVSGLTFTSTGDRITIKLNADSFISCSDGAYAPLDFDVLCQNTVGFIQVNAFLDENNDGIFNGIDTPFTNGFSTYEVNNDGNITTVNSNTESYTITNQDEANSYDITYAVYPEYVNCFNIPTALVENISVLHGNTVTVNFPITEQMPCEDLAVYLVPIESPRPGFDTRTELRLENVGSSEITSGTATFQHDALVNYVSSNTSDTGLAITPTGTGVTIDFTTLSPGESKTVLVLLNTPASVALAELVTNSLEYTTATNDIISANNTSSVTLEVVGSYDPNDVIESHGSDIVYDDFVTTDEYLYYTIRFQNVGTAEAITVRVENTINTLLDMSTLQMLSSSHDFVLMQNGNQLTWTFDNINLPAQSQDDFGSNGYVYLKIKPTTGYNVGTIIPDTAEIYFDFNAPVVTNTFLTEYVNTLSVSEFDTNGFSIYPNPVKETLYIQLDTALSGNASVEIIDVQGKIIVQYSISKTLNINVENFEPGLYFVKLNHNNGDYVKKLIIK